MHKKPVQQGGDPDARRASSAGAAAAVPRSAGAAAGLFTGRRPARAARLVALAVGIACAAGTLAFPRSESARRGPWPGLVHPAHAEGDPLAPPSDPGAEPPGAPPADPATSASPARAPGTEPVRTAAPPARSEAATAVPGQPAAAATPSTSSAGARDDKFRDLERRTFELKDQVFRAKARLTLLSETLVSANVGTTRAVIVHKNQMSRLFQPIRVSYQIDGREVFTKEDPTGVAVDGKDVVVWDGGLQAGEHTVGVTVVYRGNGAKVLSYYDKYNFTARAAHRLTAVEGQTTRLVVRCFEKGTALTAKVEDRPDFEFKIVDGSPAAKAASGGPAAAGKPAEPRPADKPAGKAPEPPAEGKAR